MHFVPIADILIGNSIAGMSPGLQTILNSHIISGDGRIPLGIGTVNIIQVVPVSPLYIQHDIIEKLVQSADGCTQGVLRRMGFEKDEMSGHGFWAMARTIAEKGLKTNHSARVGYSSKLVTEAQHSEMEPAEAIDII